MSLRQLIGVTAILLAQTLIIAGAPLHAQDYDERFRPQFHFSAAVNWLNDPNGLVYADGLYHLFYQYNPAGLTSGPMHWGHATSPDLLHWTQLPIALYPDEIGPIWSGGAVVDADNTSGLVPDGGLVAIFSFQNQSQGIAFSQDGGETWTKYAGNPILPTVAKDFRDPKVFWHADTSQWVMIIAAGDRVQIYHSPNLIDWQLASEFGQNLTAGLWEVPDLFPMTLDGETYWVLMASLSNAPAGGAGVRYFVGAFDGTTFTANSIATPLWLDYGPDNYAGTTWNQVPDDRRIYIGWMSNWMYAQDTPTSPWRGAMTLPRELTLQRTDESLRLFQAPVTEVAELRAASQHWSDLRIESESCFLGDHFGTSLEITAEFELGSAEFFGLRVLSDGEHSTDILYNSKLSSLLVNRFNSGETGFSSAFAGIYQVPLEAVDGRIWLHIFVDRSSVEVFGNDGERVISTQVFPPDGAERIELFAKDGDVRLVSLEITALNSIWR